MELGDVLLDDENNDKVLDGVALVELANVNADDERLDDELLEDEVLADEVPDDEMLNDEVLGDGLLNDEGPDNDEIDDDVLEEDVLRDVMLDSVALVDVLNDAVLKEGAPDDVNVTLGSVSEVLAKVVLDSVLLCAVVLDVLDVVGTRSLVRESREGSMLESVVFEKLNLEEVLLEAAVGSFDGVGTLMGIDNLEDVERTEEPGVSRVTNPEILVGIATEAVVLSGLTEILGVVDASELTTAERVDTILEEARMVLLLLLVVGVTKANTNSN